MKSLFFILSTLALPIYAQTYSPSCTAYLTAYDTSPMGVCSGGSLVDTLIVFDPLLDFSKTYQTYADAICPTTPCTQAVIDESIADLISGCGEELDAGDQFVTYVYAITANYLPQRAAFCLADKHTHAYCAVDFIATIQLANGTNITNFIFDSAINATSPHQLCTDCVKAFTLATQEVYIWNTTVIEENSYSLETLVLNKCGPHFLDGGFPKSVVELGVNATIITASSTIQPPEGTGRAKKPGHKHKPWSREQ